MDKKEKFLQAIREKKVVKIEFNSKSKGVITRDCIPFDFGPSNKFNNRSNRYHFYDLNSPQGKHVLSITPNQLISIDIMAETFDPKDYVKWAPKWFVERDWGKYS